MTGHQRVAQAELDIRPLLGLCREMSVSRGVRRPVSSSKNPVTGGMLGGGAPRRRRGCGQPIRESADGVRILKLAA
jgi:hypothetical protein